MPDNKEIKIITKEGLEFDFTRVVLVILFVALVSTILVSSDFSDLLINSTLTVISIYFAVQVFYILQARWYKKVDAEVNDFYIIRHQRINSENISPNSVYEVVVNYTYEFNEKTYESSKVGIDKSLNTFEEKLSFTDDDKAKADSVQYLKSILSRPVFIAYVNPYYQKEAVLDIGVKSNVIIQKLLYFMLAAIFPLLAIITPYIWE